MAGEDEAPGRDAITNALRALHGDQEPRCWKTLIGWSMGGPDPLDVVSCYEASDHWHFVSYGLSELYDKASTVTGESGFGLELTFRLRRREGETAPPSWPVELLQDMARWVYRSGKPFRAGQWVDRRGPLDDGDSTMTALAFATDPQLGSIDTPNGRVRFLQMVGVTTDELATVKDWRTEGVLELLAKDDSLLVTDPARASILQDPAVRAAVAHGISAEGSSLDASRADVLDWRRADDGGVRITVGAIAVPDVRRAVGGRIPFGRPYRLQGPAKAVVFWPAGKDEDPEEADEDVLFVELSPEHARVVRNGLEQRAGTYRWPEVEGLTIEVRQTELRDADGEVLEVLG